MVLRRLNTGISASVWLTSVICLHFQLHKPVLPPHPTTTTPTPTESTPTIPTTTPSLDTIPKFEIRTMAVGHGFGDLVIEELPSQKTLLRVQQNYGTKGMWRHLPWESYWSQAEEERHIRTHGDVPIRQNQLLCQPSGIVCVDTSTHFEDNVGITNWTRLFEVMQLRLIVFTTFKICSKESMQQLHTAFHCLHITPPPAEIRSAYINEVRLTDRLIVEDIHTLAQGGEGSISEGLNLLCNAGRGHHLCSNTLPCAISLPDRGQEPPSSKTNNNPARNTSTNNSTSNTTNGACRRCGKKRADHPDGLFCGKRVPITRGAGKRWS